MSPCSSRRAFLRVGGAALLAPLTRTGASLAAAARGPTSPVSIARCKTYDREALLGQLRVMMDQLGGIESLFRGKTVAVKVNLTGNPQQKALGLPASLLDTASRVKRSLVE